VTGCSAPCTAPDIANQGHSVHRHDGLTLHGAYVVAAVRCAPPANKPTPEERDTCLPFLEREMALLPEVKVILVLGQFAYDVMARHLGVRPRPKFGHGVEVPLADGRTLICSYPPQPAEHLHRHPHRADVRRRLHPRPRADRS